MFSQEVLSTFRDALTSTVLDDSPSCNGALPSSHLDHCINILWWTIKTYWVGDKRQNWNLLYFLSALTAICFWTLRQQIYQNCVVELTDIRERLRELPAGTPHCCPVLKVSRAAGDRIRGQCALRGQIILSYQNYVDLFPKMSAFLYQLSGVPWQPI